MPTAGTDGHTKHAKNHIVNQMIFHYTEENNKDLKNIIGVKFVFNSTKKRKSTKVKPDITLKDVEAFVNSPQTCQSLLSICNIV